MCSSKSQNSTFKSTSSHQEMDFCTKICLFKCVKFVILIFFYLFSSFGSLNQRKNCWFIELMRNSVIQVAWLILLYPNQCFCHLVVHWGNCLIFIFYQICQIVYGHLLFVAYGCYSNRACCLSMFKMWSCDARRIPNKFGFRHFHACWKLGRRCVGCSAGCLFCLIGPYGCFGLTCLVHFHFVWWNISIVFWNYSMLMVYDLFCLLREEHHLTVCFSNSFVVVHHQSIIMANADNEVAYLSCNAQYWYCSIVKMHSIHW